MSYLQVSYTALKERRNAKRLWLEGLRLEDAGFYPSSEYTVAYDFDTNSIELVLCEKGKGTHVVSGRKRRGTDRIESIIDLCNKDVVNVFSGAMRVRAMFSEGRISVTLHHEERARIDRESRTRHNVEQGTFTEGTLCAGIGVATHATHEGLKKAGIQSTVEWIVDVEGRYLQVALDNNPSITKETRLFQARLEEIESELLGFVDCMQVSLPCTGHSKSGKSKNKIKNAEDHNEAATSVFGFINILRSVNPSIVISENVVESKNSATYSLIRKELERRGYVIHEKIMGRQDAGTLEERNRYWFVAVSKGLVEFDLNDLPQFAPIHKNMGDIMEDIPQDDSMWSQNQYLKDKAISDALANKGFAKRQLITSESLKCSCLGRGYFKRRSTESQWVRDDGMERLFTVSEHALVKRVPFVLVENIYPSLGHEGLGQSCLFPHAYLLSLRFGEALLGKKLTTGFIYEDDQDVNLHVEYMENIDSVLINEADQNTNVGQLSLELL
ncbi:MAG: DNA cytosine methyltransferase [Methylococcales bacterium]